MQWITDETLQAICRTFLHSLWQGMIAAVLAGLVLLFTRHATARARYNMLGGILLLSLLAAGFTFYLEIASSQATTVSDNTYIIAAAPSAIPSVAQPVDILLQYMNAHAGLIMLVWLIVFMFKCCRLMGGFYHIRRIRQEAKPAAGRWNEQVLHLSRRLGIAKTVTLFETGIVKIPFTLGFLKPCIYIPLGLLAQLPADQVETILLHELAHIRRKDYIVNILQNFSDTIFFFNPAMLWISALLREEREACCDDIVIAHTPQQTSYIYALVAFQEKAAGIQLGVALQGKQQHLLNRVKRLMTRENKKLSIMERSILMLSILAITAFSFMPVLEKSPTAIANAVTPAQKDTSIKKVEFIIDTVSPGKTIKRISEVHFQVDTAWGNNTVNHNSSTDVHFQIDTVHINNSVNHNTNVNVDVQADVTTDAVHDIQIKTTSAPVTITADTIIVNFQNTAATRQLVLATSRTNKKNVDSILVLKDSVNIIRKDTVLKLKTSKPSAIQAPSKPTKPVKSTTTVTQPKNELILPGALMKTLNIRTPQEGDGC